MIIATKFTFCSGTNIGGILKVCFIKSEFNLCIIQTGLNALHIAAYYGNSDFVLEMLKHVPASSRSEPPIYNHYVVKEFATEVRKCDHCMHIIAPNI